MSEIFSHTDVNKRENNEDSCLTFKISPRVHNNQGAEISILLLSDGMGGHQYGEIVSNTVINETASFITKSIMNKFTNPALDETQFSPDVLDFEKFIANAIIYCNDRIRKLIENNKWKKAGATLVIVIVVDNTYYWGYLGDSRLYHWKHLDSKLNQITNDHSVVGIAVQQGAITPQVAKFHSQKHQLAYYMGVEKIPSLEKLKYVGAGTLQRNDILFLCSDGICGKPNNEQLEYLFIKHLKENPAKNKTDINDNKVIDLLIKDLFTLGLDLDETDNQTLILYANRDLDSTEIAKAYPVQIITHKQSEKEVKKDSSIETPHVEAVDSDEVLNQKTVLSSRGYRKKKALALNVEE